jgi:hypothetical protein
MFLINFLYDRSWTSSLPRDINMQLYYWLGVCVRSTTFSLVCRMLRVSLMRYLQLLCSPVLRLPHSLQTTSGRQVQETAVATQSSVVSGMTYLIVTWFGKIHNVPRDAIHKLSVCLLCHVHEGNGLLYMNYVISDLKYSIFFFYISLFACLISSPF